MQVIETKYKGITFRSRLEARWAVFFDSLGLRWEYEPQGYKLKNGVNYLPDFFVHGVGGCTGAPRYQDGIFVEVKGDLSDYDMKKMDGFSYPIYMVGNIPQSTNVWGDIYQCYSSNPEYMFSEYTIDGVLRPVWFAFCVDGIRLLGIDDTKGIGFCNWCEGQCASASSYKFEYRNTSNTQNTNRRSRGYRNDGLRFDDIMSNLFGLGGMGHDYTTESMAQKPGETDAAYKARMEYERELERNRQEANLRAKQQVEEERRKREEIRRKLEREEQEKAQERRRESERKREQELRERRKSFEDSIVRISSVKAAEIFLGMPGVVEYKIDTIAHVCIETEFPVDSRILLDLNYDQRAITLSYKCDLYRDSFHYEKKGMLIEFYESGAGNLLGRTNWDKMIRVLNKAVEFFNQELKYVKQPDEEYYNLFCKKKEEQRKEYLQKIESERIAKEEAEKRRVIEQSEYDAFMSEKNPYQFGHFLELFKQTVEECGDRLEYANRLSEIKLAKVKAEDTFGTEGAIINLAEEDGKWVVKPNRHYYFTNSLGRTVYESDGRSWFVFDEIIPEQGGSIKRYTTKSHFHGELSKLIVKTAEKYKEELNEQRK